MYCDLLTIRTWGHPSPLRHADVLNGWSQNFRLSDIQTDLRMKVRSCEKLNVFSYSAANLQIVPYWISFFLYNKCTSLPNLSKKTITRTCQGMGDGASMPPTILTSKLNAFSIHVGIFAQVCPIGK